MSDPILIDPPEERVLRLTINRPDVLNAFTWDMYQTLIDTFSDVRACHRPATKSLI